MAGKTSSSRKSQTTTQKLKTAKKVKKTQTVVVPSNQRVVVRGDTYVNDVSQRTAKAIANAPYNAKKAKWRSIATAVGSDAAARTAQSYNEMEAAKAQANASVRIAEANQKGKESGIVNTTKPEMEHDGTVTDPSEEGKVKTTNPYSQWGLQF